MVVNGHLVLLTQPHVIFPFEGIQKIKLLQALLEVLKIQKQNNNRM